jgi:hypothetical protein
MVTYTRESRSSDAYRSCEEQVRAACFAVAQRPTLIHAITISQSTDRLGADEVSAIIGLARGLASDARLALEVEASGHRLVLRVSEMAEPEMVSDSSHSARKTWSLWHLLAWLRRE